MNRSGLGTAEPRRGMDDDAAFIEQCRAAVERRLAELTPERADRPGRLVAAAR